MSYRSYLNIVLFVFLLITFNSSYAKADYRISNNKNISYVKDQPKKFYEVLNKGHSEKSKNDKNIDPYERYNRDMFRFNEKLDKYILKPVSTAYYQIIPRPLTSSVNRAFLNLDNLAFIFNDVLQFHFYQAMSDWWRFIINSTVGVFGIFDVAVNTGLYQNTEDFGLTLAQWGYKNSNYVVLPFYGSKTVRDILAMPVNYFTTLYPYIDKMRLRNGLYTLDIVNKRTQLLRFQNVYEQMALDPYVFVRNAYMQRRKYLIANESISEDKGFSEGKSEKVNNQLYKDEDYYYLDE